MRPISTLWAKSVSTVFGSILIAVYPWVFLASIVYYGSVFVPAVAVLIVMGIFLVLQTLVTGIIVVWLIIFPSTIFFYLSLYLQLSALVTVGYPTITIALSYTLLTILALFSASSFLVIVFSVLVFFLGLVLFVPTILGLDLLVAPMLVPYGVVNGFG